jgi:hypothetical protein
MRARAVVISLLIMTLVTPGVAGWSAEEITHPAQTIQIQSDPIPPHRLMAAPIDAAVFDKPPVAIKHVVVHKKATKKKVVHKKVVYKANGSWTSGNWSRFSAKVQKSALCIAHHESWSAGLWRAKNRSSTASGFAQWLDGTWRVQAKRAGVGTQYSRAYLAPPAVQAAVFAYQASHYGLYPWNGTNCPGT